MEFKLFDSIEEMKRVLEDRKPRLVRAGNRNICVIREGDQLIAFENECPHMGESLNRGLINYQNEIVCPLHSYRFNINTGESNHGDCGSLIFIKIKLEDEVILDI